MSGINAITATVPDIISAVIERSCDKWGLFRCVIGGEQFPTLNCSLEMRKFASDEAGVTWSPHPAEVISMPDLFAESVTDPKVAQLINLFNEIAAERLTAAGKI